MRDGSDAYFKEVEASEMSRYCSNVRMFISSESSIPSVISSHLCAYFCIMLPFQGIDHEGLNEGSSKNDRKMDRFERYQEGRVSQTWFLDVGTEERVWDDPQMWEKHGRI